VTHNNRVESTFHHLREKLLPAQIRVLNLHSCLLSGGFMPEFFECMKHLQVSCSRGRPYLLHGSLADVLFFSSSSSFFG
jgi:hypothetical protein